MIVKDLQNVYPENLFMETRAGKQGLGTAYIHGFKWAIEKQYDYIFEMDADFSHSPDDLMKLRKACLDGADAVVGSRYIKGVNVVNWPMSRVLMSYFASVYVRFITGIKVQDATAGFMCYKRKVLETVELNKIKFVGYAFQIEMKYTIIRHGFNLVEIPIIFTDRTAGTSKMSTSIFREAFLGVIQMRINSIFRKYPEG
jgi:dolichol-phosphate mannosyltransferase